MTPLRAGPSLGAGLAITGLSVCAAWRHYFALGGSHTLSELLVYLDGAAAWTPIEHDVAAQALNEYCDTMGLGYLVAYAHELAKAQPTAGEGPGADPQKGQLLEELLQRAVWLRLLGQALAYDVSESAGRIARTVDELARVREAIANNGVSTPADHPREHAERARRFAQHERHEQQRWSRIADRC